MGKFIEFFDQYGDPVLFNIEHISAITKDADKNRTHIFTTGCTTSFVINLDYATVVKSITSSDYKYLVEKSL